MGSFPVFKYPTPPNRIIIGSAIATQAHVSILWKQYTPIVACCVTLRGDTYLNASIYIPKILTWISMSSHRSNH